MSGEQYQVNSVGMNSTARHTWVSHENPPTLGTRGYIPDKECHPTEKKWEKQCFEVFSQELEEMNQELSKDGEDHKLGDAKTPHWTYILSVCTRLTSVFLSIHFIT